MIWNAYFAFNNLDQPIQHYLDERIQMPLAYNFRRFTKAYVRENRYVLNDDIFGFQQKEGKFYSVNSYHTRLDPYQSNFYHLKIEIDSQIDEYERTVTTLLDATGTLGGIFELLEVLFGLFIGIVSDKLFDYYVTNTMHADRRRYYDKLKSLNQQARERKRLNQEASER